MAVRVHERGGTPVIAGADGVFVLEDVRLYYVEADEPLPDFRGVTRRLPKGVVEFKPLNFHGEGRLGPFRFRVQTPKLSPEAMNALLNDVVAEAAGLAFDFEAPAGLRFRVSSEADEVPFHLLAWLRHVLLVQLDDGLEAHFLQVARQPHRVVDIEPVRPGEDEVASAMRLVARVLAKYPR
jgi:hypothetical protein